MTTNCPKCDGVGTLCIGVEYSYDTKYRYDGVSEWRCENCGYREGRFCGRELKEHEMEPPFCRGKHNHPIEIDV